MSDADFVESIGLPLLAHRLRRASDVIVQAVNEVFDRLDLDIPPRAGSLLMLLERDSEVAVTVAAKRLRLSHPMVISLARTLAEADIVETRADPRDNRRRMLRLTKKGRRCAARLHQVNEALTEVFTDMFDEAQSDLFASLKSFETVNARQSIVDRLSTSIASSARSRFRHRRILT